MPTTVKLKKTQKTNQTTQQPGTEVPDYSQVKVIIHTPNDLSGQLLLSFGARNIFHELTVQEQDPNMETLQQKPHLAQIPLLDLVTGLGAIFVFCDRTSWFCANSQLICQLVS